MPKCKNCGARLSKLDNDICPVCGEKNPLLGVSSETVEITSQLDIQSDEFKDYHPKKRFVAFILSTCLGFTGAPFFYLHFLKAGIISLISNLVVLAGLFLMFLFLIHVGLLFAILIPIIISFSVNTIIGIFFLIKEDFKDGYGEFLK